MNAHAQTEVGVIRQPEPAAALLHPLRRRLLTALREPHSATTLAPQMGLPRQKLNYHLRELERHGLVELVEQRRRGNCTERVLRARARAYVISPEAVGGLAADPDRIRDHFSSAYLTALAARAVSDVGRLRQRADSAGKRLATFSLESEVRFASPSTRAAFAEELADAVAQLVEKYHDEGAPQGRRFRVIVGAYPNPPGRRGDAQENQAERA